jgi:hypothetical protein
MFLTRIFLKFARFFYVFFIQIFNKNGIKQNNVLTLGSDNRKLMSDNLTERSKVNERVDKK